MAKDAVPSIIIQLVARFREQRETYLRPEYNETQLRRDFVDPFFRALGWDVDNSQGYAEAYRDVVHEDRVKVAGSSKAPDYAFRIGGTRKFFVETKKPSVNIKMNPESAFQLRRYAWSAKLSLSVLTDFEEFAVYDTRVRPAKSDSPSVARNFYITYDQYEERWQEIAALFSREAVLKGGFDRYAVSTKKRRGTAEVDDEFLTLINDWREGLARNINKNNPDLSDRDLNHAVQTTIDRIIFLRICEDRGTESYGRLQGAAASKGGVYEKLLELYYDADGRYNSGLFHFKKEKGREAPDSFTPGLKIDNKVLKEIIASIYYPSPYDFRVFPPDVLGQVYERFLGQVITRSSSGKSVEIQLKPEVRKAGGVYYTPTYIVEYIVENTVGELVTGRNPHEVAGRTEKTWKPAAGAHPTRVLDPACGSGSFLLGAYQFLLDWYLNRYMENPVRWSRGNNPTVVQNAAADVRLTIAERKRILTDHIFGVDIDRQAVEVTKLSLLLKCLEGESSDSIGSHLFHMNERALPDLSANIQCGNSLIEQNFYEIQTSRALSTEDRLQINAFDWRKGFPQVFADEGFDAVIGNPPYVLLQALESQNGIEYLSNRFRVAAYKIDTYHLFLEAAIELTRIGGKWGMIVPNSFLRNRHAIALRSLLLDQGGINHLVRFNYPVFRAAVETVVITGTRVRSPSQDGLATVAVWNAPSDVASQLPIPLADWRKHPRREFEMPRNSVESSLIGKLEVAGTALGQFAHAYFGIQTHDRTSFVSPISSGQNWKPCIDGAKLSDYLVKPSDEFVCVDDAAIKSGGNHLVHESDRIGVRQIGMVPTGTVIPGGLYSLNTIYNIRLRTDAASVSLDYLLGILLSSTIRWYWRQRFFDFKARFPKVKKEPLESIPVPLVDCQGVPNDAKGHDELTGLVSRRRSVASSLARSQNIDERVVLVQQAAELDQEIDRFVYRAFGLDHTEVNVIEASTAASDG